MKFAALAIPAALAVLAAVPAAADVRVSSEPVAIVRVSIVDKTDAQVAADIKAAAQDVCRTAFGPCVEQAVAGARSQYAAIKRARRNGAVAAQMSKVEVIREDRATIRVKVAGRPADQISADIDVAARSVCKAVNAGDFMGCVGKATREAKAQLREMAEARPAQVASR